MLTFSSAKRRFAAITASVLAAALMSSSVAATVYSDQATFVAATPGLSIIDFNGLASPFGVTNYGPSYTTQGVTFADTQVYAIDQAYAVLAAGIAYGSDYLEWEQSNPQILTVTFQSAVNAVGFNFMEARALTSPFSITVNGELTVVNSGSTPLFFGYTSVNPFTSLTISAPSILASDNQARFATIDNFRFGTAAITAGVPEPTTWAMMLMGFGAMGFAMRRRKGVASLIQTA